MGEEEKHGLTALHSRKTENLEDQQLMYASSVAAHHIGDMKQEYFHGYGNQEVQAGSNKLGPWSQILQPVISSPRSCITTSLSRNMLDFTSSKSDQRLVQYPPDNSSEVRYLYIFCFMGSDMIQFSSMFGEIFLL